MSKTKTRIYLVTQGVNARLVEAASPAGARNHVARETLHVSVANTKQVASLVADGVKVEAASENATE